MFFWVAHHNVFFWIAPRRVFFIGYHSPSPQAIFQKYAIEEQEGKYENEKKNGLDDLD
jgi:hypothetical protein